MSNPIFPSVEAFYVNDARRRHSGERDFGVWWYADAARRVPWRVSWVEETGEVYAVRLAPPTWTLLGPPFDDSVAIMGGDELGPVELLGSTVDVEQTLRGWADQCGRPQSLDWVRARFQ